MKAKLIAIFLIAALLGCHKDTSLVFNGQLTDCTTCTYSYYEHADYNASLQPIAGNYRVFQYKTGSDTSCGPSSSIYFKTSLSDGQFVINSAQIAAGQALGYYFGCPCCDYFSSTPNEPIGGEIKAERISPNKWLINAIIIMGYQNKAIDTITVNQYFSLRSL